MIELKEGKTLRSEECIKNLIIESAPTWPAEKMKAFVKSAMLNYSTLQIHYIAKENGISIYEED